MTQWQWFKVISEIGWAIELTVMFNRWCEVRGIEVYPTDLVFFKHHWVRMCMRLGDQSAHRILELRDAGVCPHVEGDDDGTPTNR